MTRYYPTVNASQLQKVKLSAQRVGLDLPRAVCEALGEQQQPVPIDEMKVSSAVSSSAEAEVISDEQADQTEEGERVRATAN